MIYGTITAELARTGHTLFFEGRPPSEDPLARRRVDYVASTGQAYAAGTSDDLHGYESDEAIGVLALRESDRRVYRVVASGVYRDRMYATDGGDES